MSRFKDAVGCTSVALLATLLAFVVPAAGQVCPCDCNGDGSVRVNELVAAVNVATGRADPSVCPGADANEDGSVAIHELVRCVRALLEDCEALLGGPPPGLRRFSLDPERSQLITTLPNAVELVNVGFGGFLDLRAMRTILPNTFLINVVDASEYVSINVPAGPVAVCVRPLREHFPVNRAGVLYCGDGNQVGVSVAQDRDLGTVAACVDDGASCLMDDDCVSGTCFGAEDCTALGGTVDTAGFGSCVGAIVGELLPEASPAGALLISPDPTGGQIVGLPVEIVTEVSTPCGDEPDAVGISAVISLTTGSAVASLRNVNNEDGATIETEHAGAAFDCGRWTGEDGAGTIVFSAPALNAMIAGGVTDVISTWLWID